MTHSESWHVSEWFQSSAPPTHGLPLAELKVIVLQRLRGAGTGGFTKRELLHEIGTDATSLPSLQRVLDELRNHHDPKIECVIPGNRWRMIHPFEAPTSADLVAVTIAQAVLAPHADAELRERIAQLVETLAQRVPQRDNASSAGATRNTSTLNLGTKVDPEVLRTLLRACRRSVVQFRYRSPWKLGSDAERTYAVEPWAVRFDDGAAHMRGWCRAAQAPRTFRIGEVEALESLDVPPAARPPMPGEIWGDDDPGLGIDHDRPGTATVRLRGPVARWLRNVVWHPRQRDSWSDPEELLERTLAYRSAREMARVLAGVMDGIESLEPLELRNELDHLVGRTSKARPIRSDDLPEIRLTAASLPPSTPDTADETDVTPAARSITHAREPTPATPACTRLGNAGRG